MKKNKFYVVWVGNKTGVFESWVECQLAVKNYRGSKYKSFIKKMRLKKHFLRVMRFITIKKIILMITILFPLMMLFVWMQHQVEIQELWNTEELKC